jgi:hypothetical protein
MPLMSRFVRHHPRFRFRYCLLCYCYRCWMRKGQIQMSLMKMRMDLVYLLASATTLEALKAGLLTACRLRVFDEEVLHVLRGPLDCLHAPIAGVSSLDRVQCISGTYTFLYQSFTACGVSYDGAFGSYELRSDIDGKS